MSGYGKTDAAKDCGTTVKEVSRAWHDARNAAAKEGGHGVPSDRHGSSSSSTTGSPSVTGSYGMEGSSNSGK